MLPTITPGTLMESTSNTGVSISWNTSEATSSELVYGLTTSLDETTGELDLSPRVTSHTLTLSNLLSCTKYYYQTVSRDAAGNEIVEGIHSFSTSGCV